MYVQKVAHLITIPAPPTNEEIIMAGYYDVNDGGGGIFIWKDTATWGGRPPQNGGLVFYHNSLANGWFERIISGGYIDVKWFGAKGNGDPLDAATNTSVLNNVFSYAAANNYNVLISKGTFCVDGTIECKFLTGIRGRIYIDGEGPQESVIRFVGDNDSPVLMVISQNAFYNFLLVVQNFSIINIPNPQVGRGLIGRGLYLNDVAKFSISNLFLNGLNIGVYIKSALQGRFESIVSESNNIGLYAEKGANGLPNLLNFHSSYFLSNKEVGTKFLGAHTVNFDSCDISYNGQQFNPSTPFATFGIDFIFWGNNGANGINVNNCYFEGNEGIADVRIVNQDESGDLDHAFSKGTHTFVGNTFNRGWTDDKSQRNAFTIYNIVAQNESTSGRIKLSIIGNGFFFSPYSYTPSASRKNVWIEPTDYLGFDVLEQGNLYMADLEKPVFNSKVLQISETTRVKAKGRINSDGSTMDSYNISSIVVTSTGFYSIFFANQMDGNYSAVVSVIGNTDRFARITYEDHSEIRIAITDISGSPVNDSFSLIAV